MGAAPFTGTARSAVLPDAVKLYTTPPEKFESVGIVPAFEESRTGQPATDSAVKELKKQAAKFGANGIILGSSGNTAGQPTVIMAGHSDAGGRNDQPIQRKKKARKVSGRGGASQAHRR